MTEKIAILGAGSWGTALAILAAQRCPNVVLWGRDAVQMEAIAKTHENAEYLPGVELPVEITSTANLKEACENAGLIIFVVPSKATRAVAAEVAQCGISPDAVLLSCAKGIEKETGLRMSEVLAQELQGHPLAVLSGPNHAEEIARRLAAAAVIGSADPDLAQRLQQLLSCPWFRTYTSTDVCGIEWGGAAKNIFAIAAGISEGLGMGDNAKAALLTRGTREMIRLGVAEGGNPETFQGLSGLGDLIVTCFSEHSRNNRVGKLIGQGKSVAEIASTMHMVAEGVPNTESIYLAARRQGVITPIIDQVYAILYQQKHPAAALKELLTRDPKAETD
jgi:glycerol-3-phosphate dehydrogenase (NAD(P)+)